MKPNEFSQLTVLTEGDFSHRSLLREERHPNSVTAPPINRGSMTPRPWRGFWNSIGTAMLVKLGAGGAAKASQAGAANATQQPWQRAATQRRLAFVALTLLSTVIASTLFARVQPDYDNLWLEYSQVALYGLLSGWVVTGFVTALMGFYVSVRGDKHALSAKQVADHPMNPDARTAIIMPICNEDVATVFAGLRATCESVAATGACAAVRRVRAVRQLHDPRSPPPSAPPGKTCAPRWPTARTSRRSRCTTACAPVARTARPATSPTSAAAGARTTATWSCSTPTAS